jgi:L-asparaginase II
LQLQPFSLETCREASVEATFAETSLALVECDDGLGTANEAIAIHLLFNVIFSEPAIPVSFIFYTCFYSLPHS